MFNLPLLNNFNAFAVQFKIIFNYFLIKVPFYSVTTLTTEKGHVNLLVDGYKFTLAYQRGERRRWHCCKQSYRGCKTVAYTEGSKLIDLKNKHNHGPDFDVMSLKILETLKVSTNNIN